jgi:uncharacterized protein YecE (DUF72 family)
LVRIGTSGWVYKHWRGDFYPADLRQKDWFGYYVGRFDTVEVNNSFYRLPGDAAFGAWARQAPAGFVYALKASRFITHLKRLKDPEEPTNLFFERAQVLGPALGPVLFQLPPHWNPDLPRLEHFLSVLPKGPPCVLEFRDPAWLVEPVFQLMERYHVSHCIHDLGSLEVPRRVTADPVYLRFHGPQRYSGNYPRDVLQDWARQIRSWTDQGLDVFAYFNNDIGGWAPRNAQELKEMV